MNMLKFGLQVPHKSYQNQHLHKNNEFAKVLKITCFELHTMHSHNYHHHHHRDQSLLQKFCINRAWLVGCKWCEGGGRIPMKVTHSPRCTFQQSASTLSNNQLRMISILLCLLTADPLTRKPITIEINNLCQLCCDQFAAVGIIWKLQRGFYKYQRTVFQRWTCTDLKRKVGDYSPPSSFLDDSVCSSCAEQALPSETFSNFSNWGLRPFPTGALDVLSSSTLSTYTSHDLQ